MPRIQCHISYTHSWCETVLNWGCLFFNVWVFEKSRGSSRYDALPKHFQRDLNFNFEMSLRMRSYFKIVTQVSAVKYNILMI